MFIKSYKDLIVWQKAMELAAEVYRLVGKLPREEMYALSDQMRRAAISIPSNIAEGQARNSTKEFAQFLSIAAGSRAEIETQLLLCEKLSLLSTADTKRSMDLADEVSRMLSVLMRNLTNRIPHLSHSQSPACNQLTTNQ